MLKFPVRFALMQLVKEDRTAYGIANQFVMDDDQKYTVFERCYEANNSSGKPQEVATVAAAASSILWREVYSVE
jgi:hypothetical protein